MCDMEFRYFRLYGINNYGNLNYISSSEIKLYDKDGKEIQISETISSSDRSSDFSISNAFDGNWDENEGGWFANSNSNEWVRIDIGSIQDVDKIVYQADAWNSYSAGIKDYRIEGSNDGEHWAVINKGRFEQNGDRQKVSDLKPYFQNGLLYEYYDISNYSG